MLALALALFVLSRVFGARNSSETEQSEVLITVDGQEYVRVSLSEEQTVMIVQADGCRNEVAVTGESVYMASSSCDNQLCVQMGEVNLENYETRPNQSFIICLPNRVTIELLPGGQ